MTIGHYAGSCQCGAVAFEVDVDLDNTITCNCSRCRRLGAVFAFAPKEAFTLTSGEGELTEYLFNRKQIHHLFCRTCGIESFAFGAKPDGSQIVAINANCLDDVDARALCSKSVDGKSL